MNWYKKALALDPQAYKTEQSPARLQQHMDSVKTPFGTILQPQKEEELDAYYRGVHFAFTPEHAAMYACGKATAEDPPVVIEVDASGLKQEADADAMLAKDVIYYLEEKQTTWNQILQSGEDKETIAEEIYQDVDNDNQGWERDSDARDVNADVMLQKNMAIPPSIILDMIQGKMADQIISFIDGLLSGDIPEEMLIKAVGQMRVNKKIDSTRVRAIYQVPWIDFSTSIETGLYDVDEEYLEEKGWHKDGDEVKNENGQIIPDYESLEYDQWLTLTPLYKNNQMSFEEFYGETSVWHGTTLSRAKIAYPELLTDNQTILAATNSWFKRR